jgi:hypothetical protein
VSTVEQQHNNNLAGSSQALSSTRTLARPIPDKRLPPPFWWSLPNEAPPDFQAEPERETPQREYSQCAGCPILEWCVQDAQQGCIGCTTEALDHQIMYLRHRWSHDIILMDVSQEAKRIRAFIRHAKSFDMAALRHKLTIYFLSLTLRNEDLGYKKNDLDRFLQWMKKKIERRYGRGSFHTIWVPEVKARTYNHEEMPALHWHLAIAVPAGTMPDYWKDKDAPRGQKQLICRAEGTVFTAKQIFEGEPVKKDLIAFREGRIKPEEIRHKGGWKRGMIFSTIAQECVTGYMLKYVGKNLDKGSPFENMRRFGASSEVTRFALPVWAKEELSEIDSIGLLEGRTWKFQKNRIFVLDKAKIVMTIRSPWRKYLGAHDQELQDQYLKGAFGNEVPPVVVPEEKQPTEVETLPFWPTEADWWNQFPHETTFSRGNPFIDREETPVFGVKRLSDMWPLQSRRGTGNGVHAQASSDWLKKLWQQPIQPMRIYPTNPKVDAHDPDPEPPPFGEGSMFKDLEDRTRFYELEAKVRHSIYPFEVVPEKADSAAQADPAGGSPPAFGNGGDHSSAGKKPRDRTKRRTPQ